MQYSYTSLQSVTNLRFFMSQENGSPEFADFPKIGYKKSPGAPPPKECCENLLGSEIEPAEQIEFSENASKSD